MPSTFVEPKVELSFYSCDGLLNELGCVDVMNVCLGLVYN